MYHSPSAPDSVFVDYLEGTERLVLKGDCIIVGDFNINILEDSFYTKKIHTIMSGLGMKQYVDKPTRVTKDSQTIIDLIFANRKINIQVCEEPKITDHAWLQIKLKIKDLEDRYKEWWGRNYSKINVHNFVLLMEENKIQGQELCVNVKANNFVNSIVNVLDIVAPKKKFRIPKVWEGKKWYTDEIREAAVIRDVAYNRALFSNTEQDWLQFKFERNAVVKRIKTKKKEYYKNLIDDNKNNAVRMWKTLKEVLKGEQMGFKKIENIDFEILEGDCGCNIADKFNAIRMLFALALSNIDGA
ncbi:hypothetical protein DMN91_006113 [Ooceraea biroi]|uniref:Endonuclease/exonuclease/phosphatase domain-containing protein n=1 Tax=Ooceraea biroi TaxID=2015173 RepID=A0A3L8DMU3_OOCBI|nr:hypothetical protein DMN91_006113 [Ooceraea biroi]